MHAHNKYSARGKGLSNLPKIFTSIQYKISHSNKIHLPLYFFSIIPRYTFNDTLSSLYYSTNNFKKKKKKKTRQKPILISNRIKGPPIHFARKIVKILVTSATKDSARHRRKDRRWLFANIFL